MNNKLNVKAWDEFVAAGVRYLQSNGWERVESKGAPKWRAPKYFGIYEGDVFLQRTAVNMQHEYDAGLTEMKFY